MKERYKKRVDKSIRRSLEKGLEGSLSPIYNFCAHARARARENYYFPRRGGMCYALDMEENRNPMEVNVIFPVLCEMFDVDPEDESECENVWRGAREIWAEIQQYYKERDGMDPRNIEKLRTQEPPSYNALSSELRSYAMGSIEIIYAQMEEIVSLTCWSKAEQKKLDKINHKLNGFVYGDD